MTTFVNSQYRTLTKGPAAYKSAAAGADSLVIDPGAPVAGLRPAKGNPYLAIAGRFTVASATVGVTLVRYNRDADGNPMVASVSDEHTLTAGALNYDDGGTTKYFAPTVVEDSEACAFWEWRITTVPSSGLVDLYAWMYGAESGEGA